jgi:hypothetical protein
MRTSFEYSSSSLLSLSHSSLDYTLVDLAMKQDEVSKREGLLLMVMLASAFFLDLFSSSLESSSSKEASLS